MKNVALYVAGIVFSLIALIHILRLSYHWLIIVGGTAIPFTASYFGLVLSIILAIWMFTAARK